MLPLRLTRSVTEEQEHFINPASPQLMVFTVLIQPLRKATSIYRCVEAEFSIRITGNLQSNLLQTVAQLFI